VGALVVCVGFDGEVSVGAVALVRVVSGALRVPVGPVLVTRIT